jgi:all-trans-retinol 13,14-reductase
MRYDVVIIGSGFGGLVCAHLLAKAGKRVLVLERQLQAGGCIQSYQRRGQAFDTGLHYVGGLGEGQKLNRIFSHLGLMRLPWHRLDPEGFDRITIGGETFAFAEGYDQFVDQLAARFPKEREALRQYIQTLQRAEAVAFGSNDAYQLFGTSAYDYLTRTFSDPLLINVLSGSALKMELRQASLPLFTFAHGNSSFIQSSWRLQGDGNLIVKSLTDDIRSFGGEVVCQAEVDELIEKDGRIVAAHSTNGEIYEGDVFISDIYPSLTFAMVKESAVLRNLFRRRMSNMENTFGMFTASLMLKPGTLPYFNHNKFVYRQSNVWTFYEKPGSVGGVMISCRVPEEGMYATQIDLLTPMPWHVCEPWADTQVGRRGADYLALKARYADECISLAETVIPGLREMVSQTFTSTPLTYRDYTLTPNGSAYGVRRDCRNLVITMLSPRTPIPNLMLTGQNLMLHGLEGVSMTALLTCQEILGTEYIKKIVTE